MEEKNIDIEKLKVELSNLREKYDSICKEYETEKICLYGLQNENRELKRNIETQFEVIKNLSLVLANKK